MIAENHTFDHASLDKVDRETFIAEVRDTDRAIHEAAGDKADPIACLRPPYGAYDAQTGTLAAELGKTLTLWTVDPQDWRRPGADQIAEHLLAHARPGAILLMHDGGGGALADRCGAQPGAWGTLGARVHVRVAVPVGALRWRPRTGLLP